VGGRISVESVAGCSWNRWPDGRGIRTAPFRFVAAPKNATWRELGDAIDRQEHVLFSLCQAELTAIDVQVANFGLRKLPRLAPFGSLLGSLLMPWLTKQRCKALRVS